MSIRIIAFDADDTLWENETFFREAEQKFCELMEDFLQGHAINRELLQTEIGNIELYGYGIKGFVLSMIETAIRISDRKIPMKVIEKIIQEGKEMLSKPVVVLPGIEEVLSNLKPKCKLVVASKGDLLDQHRKLTKSGLGHYFHHIEIMSEKREQDYQKLIGRLDIAPHELLMIGNSLKSDVLPVLNIGGYGIHVPYHTTWVHEEVKAEINHPHFRQAATIGEALKDICLDKDQPW